MRFLISSKASRSPGCLCDRILNRRAPLGWVNSRVSLGDLLHGRKRDCDKRHVRAVQALRSALLGVKTDLTLSNLQAPRADCAAAESTEDICSVLLLRGYYRYRGFTWTGFKPYDGNVERHHAALPLHQKRAWRSHRGSWHSPAISPSRLRTIWWPWLALPWPDPSA